MGTRNVPMNAGNQKIIDLKRLLENKKGNIAAVLPSHMTPERLIKIALVACSRAPALLACSAESIYSSLMDASQLGLEPFTGLNLSYIIPYRNGKTGVNEAKFIPSYRGMIELARRTGQIKSIDADVVYEKDRWEVEKGLTPKLVHVPLYDGKDRGKPVLVYAIARFKDGGYQFEVMTIQQVEFVRTKSKSSNSGPWVEFWDEMARKTCLKKLLKLCPMSTDLAKAVARDNAAETDDDYLDADYIDIDSANETELEKAATKADDLAARIGGTVAG